MNRKIIKVKINVHETIMLLNLQYWLVGWLCLTSHRQRGHLETAPPFTVPCEGCEAPMYSKSKIKYIEQSTAGFF